MTDRKDTFVVMHAALHGVTATHREMNRARRIRNFQGRRADAVIFSEAYRQKRWLATAWVMWHCVTGPRTPRDARGRISSWDVIIMVRMRYRTIWKHARLAAEAAEPLKIAPRRWLVEWRGKTNIGKLSLVFEHPHAAISVDYIHSKRVQEYIKQAHLFHARLADSIVSGFPTVAGGDLNYGRHAHASAAPEWSPQKIFSDLHMEAHNEGVDWLAQHGLRVIDTDIIPPSVNGQDHPWIMMTLAKR